MPAKAGKDGKPMRVAVLMGGFSSEREVSLRTGKAVVGALGQLGHEVIEVDLGEEPLGQLLPLKEKVDAGFIALHGRGGEDGTVQGALELLGIPYTGSGVMSSAVAMDKNMTKRLLADSGVPVIAGVALTRQEIRQMGIIGMARGTVADLGLPSIVKPNCEGSTVGISVARNLDEMEKGITLALDYDDIIIVEKFIEGRELTVGLVGEAPLALPVLEVVPKKGIYDYECKYSKGMTDYIVPAEIPPKIALRLQELAIKAHKSLECEGISRVDFILGKNHRIYCLEVNTIPGMTELSLVPMAAAAMDMSFTTLVEMILATARLKSCFRSP